MLLGYRGKKSSIKKVNICNICNSFFFFFFLVLKARKKNNVWILVVRQEIRKNIRWVEKKSMTVRSKRNERVGPVVFVR